MKQSKYFIVILAFLLILVSNIVSCRSTVKSKDIKATTSKIDYDPEGFDKRYKPCLNDEDLNELCERCMRIAKVDGDDIFAMCCADDDGAQDFCRNYVFYGITK